MTSPSYIAPHLREHIFRAYEDVLATAVRNWPTETAFDVPTGIATATFLGNFRNAVVSLERYHWPTSIDTDKLATLSNPRVFRIVLDADTRKVVFCSVRKPAPRVFTAAFTKLERQTAASIPASTALDSTGLVPWGDCTDADVESLCILLDKKRLTGPYFLEGRVRADFVDHLQTIFDVALVYDEATNTTTVT